MLTVALVVIGGSFNVCTARLTRLALDSRGLHTICSQRTKVTDSSSCCYASLWTRLCNRPSVYTMSYNLQLSQWSDRL